MGADARHVTGAALASALRDSRVMTFARTLDLDDGAWRVPPRAGVNLVAWELGHLAWFAEFWILRGPHRLDGRGFVDAARPPRFSGADAIFDSARLAHADRWRVALPDRAELLAMLDAQLEACIAAIASGAPGSETNPDSDGANYFHRLSLFHEDMHGEAFAWLRATLGLPAPAGVVAMPHVGAGGPIEVSSGVFEVGRAVAASGFSFDNEEPRRLVRLDSYVIDSAPVTNGEFLRFVAARGYENAAFWPAAAGAWRAAQATAHPRRWRKRPDGRWEARWFDRWSALDEAAPVVHVNAWEAGAYCRWAGRRLPQAAEWERASADPRFRWGHSVWEWTADAFEPYPGFVPGPYRDYSKPWFGDHRELRGGAFATHERLHHPAFRNFFTPERTDVFAGFRCATSLR